MSANSYRKLRNDEDTHDLTVHSNPSRHQRRARATPEEGLSVDADQLGDRFLSDATEQSNFEGELEQELSLHDGAMSDEALASEDLDADGTIWDQTIRRSPRSDIREIRNVAVRGDGVDPDSPDDEDTEDAPRTVDVRQTHIVNASLFDDETDEPGETRSPTVRADDQD